MKSLLLTLAALLLAPVVTLYAADPAMPAKPKILVIVADDLGYGDIGVHGGRDVPTPHIDALAASGTRCTNGYVSAPYCSPSRAGFLTGRYQTRFGHEFNPHVGEQGKLGLPLDSAPSPTAYAAPATPRAWSANVPARLSVADFLNWRQA
jgi:hypothetical protein